LQRLGLAENSSSQGLELTACITVKQSLRKCLRMNSAFAPNIAEGEK
jgi:hypothetical protein